MSAQDNCPKCGDWIVTDGATFTDYECGSSWDEIDGWQFSEKCKNKREENHERTES